MASTAEGEDEIMPERPRHIPTYRERSALQSLFGSGWLAAANLYPAGPSTIFRMVTKGWLERKSDGGWKYRITPHGEAAFKALIPDRPSRSRKSKTGPGTKAMGK